jgi:hypothetical protein
MIPKPEKCIKGTQNVLNGHKISHMYVRKIFQMDVKGINIFQSKAHQKYPIRNFWFENKPTGNPVPKVTFQRLAKRRKKYRQFFVPSRADVKLPIIHHSFLKKLPVNSATRLGSNSTIEIY